MRLYAKIEKTEKQDDGTLKVWGYASTEAVDSDGEVVSARAIKAALPDYLKFGAVREMHQPIAAGTAIEAEVLEDGRTWFGAHVVDPVAVKKVESGVYKGFSIGGKVTARDELNKNLITGLSLVEISLVDRPANPEAVFTMFKADTQSTSNGVSGNSAASHDDEEVDHTDENVLSGLPESALKALKTLLVACQSVQDALVDLGCNTEDHDADDSHTNSGEQDQERLDIKEEVSTKGMLIEHRRVARIAKAANIPLSSGADMGDLLKASISELMTLRKQYKELLTQPESPRMALHAVALGKTEDGLRLTQGTRPVVKSDGVADEVATLIKAAQARPVSLA